MPFSACHYAFRGMYIADILYSRGLTRWEYDMFNDKCFICEQEDGVILDQIAGTWYCLICFDKVERVFEEHYVNGRMRNRTAANWISAVESTKECCKHSLAVH